MLFEFQINISIYLTSSLGYLVDIPDLTSTKTNGLPSLSNLKLHPTIQKSWHPWRLSLSLLTWNLLENPVFSTFKTNIKLNQFSPPPLLPPYFKLSSLFASSITPLWFKQRDQLKPKSCHTFPLLKTLLLPHTLAFYVTSNMAALPLPYIVCTLHPVPGMLFPQVTAWLISSLSSICSNDSFLMRSWVTFIKLPHMPTLCTPYSLILPFFILFFP